MFQISLTKLTKKKHKNTYISMEGYSYFLEKYIKRYFLCNYPIDPWNLLNNECNDNECVDSYYYIGTLKFHRLSNRNL